MKKSLIFAVGSLVLLIAVLVVQQRGVRALYGRMFALDSRQKDEVVSLRVMQGEDTAAFLKLGGRWVSAEDSFPTGGTRMESALMSLYSLQTKEKVSNGGDSARLAEFGFWDPDAKSIEWTLASGKTFRVALGRAVDEEYSATYWKWKDRPEVYRTPGHFHGVTPQSVDWKDRTVFPDFLYENVQAVETDWRDSTGRSHHYRLERISDTAVRMVEPDTAPVPRKNAAEIYVQTPQFAVDDFVQPGDSNVSRAGLDTPSVVVRITMKDGTLHQINAGRVFDGYQYARHPEHGHPIKISRWRFDFFKKTVEQILKKPTPG